MPIKENRTSTIKCVDIYLRKEKMVFFIFDLSKTWEKLILAARVIVAVENPADVCLISSNQKGQRACLKFAQYTGATAFSGRFTPGTFTNQIQEKFLEPRLLIVCDPRTDHQPVTEATYVNVPTIAFCNSDSPTKKIDIAIPCNNESSLSIGLMYWLLAREVLRLRGTISREVPWEVIVDAFFYKSPEELERKAQEEAAHSLEEAALRPPPETTTAPTEGWGAEGSTSWGDTDFPPAPHTSEWTEGEAPLTDQPWTEEPPVPTWDTAVPT
jgi:small subunit ribosomal protein SAe